VNRGYTLTGLANWSFAEVAQILSDALKRYVTYQAASIIGYVQHLRQRKLPLSRIAIQTLLHVDLRRGRAGIVDPALEQLLGRASFSMQDDVRDHLERWAPEVFQ
jgi:hypothetical protein